MKRFLTSTILALTFASQGLAQAGDARFNEIATSPNIQPKVEALIEGQDSWVPFVVLNGGPESPGRIFVVNGQPWQIYTTCRTHMCGDYKATMAVSSEGEPFLFLTGSEVKDQFLGNPPQEIQKLMRENTQ